MDRITIKAGLTPEEIDKLLNLLWEKYSYDFRSYARASLSRRIDNFMILNSITTPGEMMDKLSREEGFTEKLIQSISVTVTEMFRDPEHYTLIRNRVLPLLKGHHQLKIWHAGCATGQEVYSLAIILQEEGFKNVEITATDLNRNSLEIARSGVYSNTDIRKSTVNYLKAGGKRDFSDYYHSRYSRSIFKKELKNNTHFLEHNLVSDTSPGSFDLILCRNVFIYFTKELQKKVLKLFTKSLNSPGYLWLGSQENLYFIDIEKRYREISKNSSIFCKGQHPLSC